MPRTSGNANHPLKLRLSFRQREIINHALLLWRHRYEKDEFYASAMNELADLQVATSRLTCQLGGCGYCTDDGPEIVYGKEETL